MKKLILIAALCASTAHAEFLTGNDLLQRLESDSAVERVAGLGYIMGVADAVLGVEQCAPGNVTAGQMRDMVRNHLTSNPSVRHITADVQVRYVLKNAWPCANSNRRGGTNL